MKIGQKNGVEGDEIETQEKEINQRRRKLEIERGSRYQNGERKRRRIRKSTRGDGEKERLWCRRKKKKD